MDWIRRNKFMTGFIAFLVVGVGGLGYLLYSSMDDYEQVSQDYTTAVTELKRLQGLEPYPAPPKLKELETLRNTYTAKVGELQTQLAAFEPPAENPPLSPIQFQEKLRRVVEDVTTRAAAANMKLPEKFYMGFELYSGQLPEVGAAPALSRELDAIQDVMNVLIRQRTDTLVFIKRAPLPTEAGGAAGTPPPAAGRPGPGRPGSTPAGDLVTRSTMEIAFVAQPSAFRDTLDQLVTAKRLFIVRALEVKNQEQKGPPREAPGANGGQPGGAPPPAPGDPSATPAPGAAPEKAALRYIVGLEKLEVDLRIELVKVAPPTVPAGPAAR